MRCISVAELGGPEVLRFLKNAPIPVPSAKQVLINVHAAGVNPVDTYLRSGLNNYKPNLPYIPGKDGAGFVTQVGKEVDKFKEGDRVWFSGSVTGSYAEYCVCDQDSVGLLPNTLGIEFGAMILPYKTAYRALFQKGSAQQGETVFIHGATGGVGTAAVQMCLFHGIDVIATAGSADGEKLLQSMGVTKIFNHRQNNYIEEIRKMEKRIDLILEMLANVNLNNDLEIVTPGGRIVVIGSRGPIEFSPRVLLKTEVSLTGVNLNNTCSEQKQQVSYISDGLSKGWLKPVLWKAIELQQAADAHTEIITNSGAKGQIVLTIKKSDGDND